MWYRSRRPSCLLESVVAGIDRTHKFKSEKQTERKGTKDDEGRTGSVKPESAQLQPLRVPKVHPVR